MISDAFSYRDYLYLLIHARPLMYDEENDQFGDAHYFCKRQIYVAYDHAINRKSIKSA